MHCNIPKAFDSEVMKAILSSTKTICFVGLSPDQNKVSYIVANFAQNNDFNIVPVHPRASEILGQKVFTSLAAIDTNSQIDMLYVIRKAEATSKIYEQAKHIKAIRSVWLPQGVINDKLAVQVQQDGLQFVQDQCLKIVYQRLY